MNKLCDRDKLEEFSNMLEDLLFCKKKLTIDSILELQMFFDMKILEKPKEDINSIKREIYSSMKMATNPKERQMYYELYQKIKADAKT